MEENPPRTRERLAGLGEVVILGGAALALRGASRLSDDVAVVDVLAALEESTPTARRDADPSLGDAATDLDIQRPRR